MPASRDQGLLLAHPPGVGLHKGKSWEWSVLSAVTLSSVFPSAPGRPPPHTLNPPTLSHDPLPQKTLLQRGPWDHRRKGEGKGKWVLSQGPHPYRGKRWGWVLWCHRNRAHSLAPHLEYPAHLISPPQSGWWSPCPGNLPSTSCLLSPCCHRWGDQSSQLRHTSQTKTIPVGPAPITAGCDPGLWQARIPRQAESVQSLPPRDQKIKMVSSCSVHSPLRWKERGRQSGGISHQVPLWDLWRGSCVYVHVCARACVCAHVCMHMHVEAEPALLTSPRWSQGCWQEANRAAQVHQNLHTLPQAQGLEKHTWAGFQVASPGTNKLRIRPSRRMACTLPGVLGPYSTRPGSQDLAPLGCPQSPYTS